MKKKIPKILSVALTVTLVASLFAFAIPASAAPGKQQWAAQTLPTATSNVLLSGSNVTDFAVASDGLTIYVASDGVAANAAGAVLISTDGGESFSALTVSSASSTGVMTSIAVAPDDADVVAVVESIVVSADVVHISTNAGKTWSALPTAYPAPVTAAYSIITDIDVGPARAGTVLGREYVVAFADTRAGDTSDGDVQIIGAIATWATVGSGTTLATSDVALIHDYMAVKFSPNFVGDRVIAAVGANASANDVVLQLINDAQKLQVRAPVGVSATATTPEDYGGSVADSIYTADIAFPSDFDPSVTSLQRTYIAFGLFTTQTDSDAYRITGSTVRDLDAVTALAIKSIAYTGTVDEGTLFIGEYLDENVKYTLDPTVSIPTWKSTSKAPSADPATVNTAPGALTIVRVSPADSNVIYAGTSSATNLESAFSVSNNAAVSFDGESLIDSVAANTVVTVDDIYLTPDGGTIFMATNDGAQLSLWKSDTPTGSTSWSRVRVVTGTAGMVRLNPDWATTPTVYFADLDSGGNIYVSTNGGDTYSTRNAPSGITATDIVVESSSTLYLASGTSVRKSTNSAWTWATPVGGKVGTILTLAMAPSYPVTPEAGHLLVGGTGGISYSTDSGTTFTLISSGLTSGSTYQILAHEDYATDGADGENTLYAGDATAGATLTYRFVIGTSTSWENLIAGGTTPVSGLGMVNGVLYSSQNAAGDGAMRTLYPTGTVGGLAWEDAAISSGTFARSPSALRVATGSNILYAIDTAATPNDVEAYSDLLATDVPILTAPVDGVAVNVNPVTGYAQDIQFAWNSMGSGTGLVDVYEIQIATAGTDFASPLSRTYGVSTGTPTPSTTGLTTTNPQLTVGATAQWTQNLMANTEYAWRIRARGQASADEIRSGWSASQKFFVQAGGVVQAPQAGVLLLGPAAGATDVSLTPGFSWAPIAGATEYEFILALDAGLTNTVEGTPVSVTQPSWQVPSTTLEYSTTYFWAVKATKPTVSVQSIGTFITMAEPVVPPPPPPPVEPPPTPEPITPTYIWAIIIIGAILMIAVIILIVRTRRVV